MTTYPLRVTARRDAPTVTPPDVDTQPHPVLTGNA